MTKVLFVLPKVPVGGVERVTLALIRGLVAEGIPCHLALRHRRGELVESFAAVAPVDVFAPGGVCKFVPGLVRLLERETPTHVVTAFHDAGFLAGWALKKAKSDAVWVQSVHSAHGYQKSHPNFVGWARCSVELLLAAQVYRRADRVVTVSEGVRGEVVNDFHVDPHKVVTIYNPVVPAYELVPVTRPPLEGRPCRILALGRLVRAKGFDLLIPAMRNVPGNWRFDIWGEGPEHAALQRAIEREGLKDKIHLRGFTARPFEVMRSADVFVMASRHEGLGNVLAEALASQCQIVAADCPHGPREILAGGRYGQLVPVGDVQALARALAGAVNGGGFVEPQALLDRARQFGVDISVQKWRAALGV